MVVVIATALLMANYCNAFTTPHHYFNNLQRRTSLIPSTSSSTARYEGEGGGGGGEGGFKKYPDTFEHPPEKSSNGPSPPQQQQQQFFDANGNPVTSMPMVKDANGNLVPFNPQTQSPPQQQQQQGTQFNTQQYAPQRNQPPQANPNAPVFQPNSPKQTGAPLPPQQARGYNSDAYTMSNTADVYFAQLKQDSKVRKMARLSGDIETSNQVFGDDSVQEIGNSWNSNPYTKE